MKSVMVELKEMLECEIEIVSCIGDNRKNQGCDQSMKDGRTVIRLNQDEALIIYRVLTPLEEQLVQRLITQEPMEDARSEASILLEPEGYKALPEKQKYPIKLWRIVFKENEEAVDEILASTFGSNKIIKMNAQERVAFVTKSPIAPADLLGMLESEALTSSRIVIGNTISKGSELHAGYRQLLDLWHLAQTLKYSEQIITYDAFLLPMLIYRLNTAESQPTFETHEKREGLNDLMKHHVKTVGDEELEHTALIFFKNNLNITETAAALFIHRNTLIYRLGKLESITGYDIRKFGDAINYYLSYLVDTIK